MISGRMDRRITLQRKTVTQDAYGQENETWIDIATVWAQKRDMRGAEQWQAQQTAARIECVFRIRYLAGITPVDRIVCAGRGYDVHGITEIGRKDGLELTASARAE